MQSLVLLLFPSFNHFVICSIWVRCDRFFFRWNILINTSRNDPWCSRVVVDPTHSSQGRKSCTGQATSQYPRAVCSAPPTTDPSRLCFGNEGTCGFGSQHFSFLFMQYFESILTQSHYCPLPKCPRG